MANTYLLFGASQRTGLEVAKILNSRGDKIHAFVRASSDRAELQKLKAEFVVGDAMEAASVDAAFSNIKVDAVVSTIGGARGQPRPDVESTRNIIDAANRHKVKRVLLVTGIGAGDSRSVLTENALKFLGPVMELKTEAESLLAASGLDWTILRPGGMASEAATGTAIKTEDHTVMGMIQRADLAALVVECLDDAKTIGHIYHTIDPEAKEQPPLQRGVQPKPGAQKP